MKSFTARLASWRQYRTSLHELSRLSERELEDLGIGRADIRAVASGAPILTPVEVDAVTINRFAPAAPVIADVQNPMRLAA